MVKKWSVYVVVLPIYHSAFYPYKTPYFDDSGFGDNGWVIVYSGSDINIFPRSGHPSRNTIDGILRCTSTIHGKLLSLLSICSPVHQLLLDPCSSSECVWSPECPVHFSPLGWLQKLLLILQMANGLCICGHQMAHLRMVGL